MALFSGAHIAEGGKGFDVHSRLFSTKKLEALEPRETLKKLDETSLEIMISLSYTSTGIYIY